MKNILVVDDDSDLRDLVIYYLREDLKESLHFFEAEGVDEALKIIDQQSVDLVISDYSMLQKTGLDLLKEQIRRPNCPQFLLHTGDPQLPQIFKGVIKKGNYDELTSVVRHLCASAAIDF